MRGNSAQYSSLRGPSQMPEPRSGRSSPAPSGFGSAMPEPRPSMSPYQQPSYPSYSAQRQTNYESYSSQYSKATHEYGRNPLPGTYPTPMGSASSESATTFTKHKNSWLEEARESTANFKKNGSPIPLVWVLVEDRTIPPNAVPFGEDRSGNTLFIARAYLEGSLHIGKVGYNTPGALISFVGKEHTIEKYEVLVCASQLRWGIASQNAIGSLAQGTVILARQQQQVEQELSRNQTGIYGQEPNRNQTGSYGQTLSRTQTGNYGQDLGRTRTGMFGGELGRSKTGSFSSSREIRESVSIIETTLTVGDIPRLIPPPAQEEQLRRVAEYKTVVLIDDSISMTEGDSWRQVGEALAGIVDIAMQYGSKGLDMHFMHEEQQYEPNMKTRYDVLKLFERYGPNGEDTPTGAKLGQIIDMYLPLIEQPNSTHEPISIIVITDGAATDGEELTRCIVETAARLDRGGVPLDRFGIQFVQIGTDEEAAGALRQLDDELSDRFKIRDIVDATPYDPAHGSFNTDYMLKILIGSLNKELDNLNMPAEVLSPARKPASLPPSVIGRRSPPAPRPSSPYVPVGNLL